MAAGFKSGGRKKGTPNKTSADVRDMVLRALNKAGGTEYLARQAEENPGPFMTLVGKVLPTQITGDPDAPVAVTIEDKRAAAKALLAETFGKHDG